MIEALRFSIEMFTTTGFGGDSPWESQQLNAFIAVMDLVGMVLLIGALPVVVTPLLEEAFSTTVPGRWMRTCPATSSSVRTPRGRRRSSRSSTPTRSPTRSSNRTPTGRCVSTRRAGQ